MKKWIKRLLLLGLFWSSVTTVFSNTDQKLDPSLNGMWCVVPAQSFIMREALDHADRFTRHQFCYYFKVNHSTRLGGGGHYIEIFKKNTKIKTKIAAIEYKDNSKGAVITKDPGLFAYYSRNGTLYLTMADSADESVLQFEMMKDKTFLGTVVEVNAQHGSHEALVGVLQLEQVSTQLMKNFQSQWNDLYKQSHTLTKNSTN